MDGSIPSVECNLSEVNSMTNEIVLKSKISIELRDKSILEGYCDIDLDKITWEGLNSASSFFLFSYYQIINDDYRESSVAIAKDMVVSIIANQL